MASKIKRYQVVCGCCGGNTEFFRADMVEVVAVKPVRNTLVTRLVELLASRESAVLSSEIVAAFPDHSQKIIHNAIRIAVDRDEIVRLERGLYTNAIKGED